MAVLEKIVQNRIKLIEKEKKIYPLKNMIQDIERLLESGYRPTAFYNSIRESSPFLIAEIKKASPSKGLIREDFNPVKIAEVYDSSFSVKAISILTEPDYFQGRYEYIDHVKNITKKPLLMKDFIIDPYQIYRGFLNGASAVLLIASVLDDTQIESLLKVTNDLNMDVLFEVHSVPEYRRASDFGINIIGINNRDLKTFVTDIYTTVRVLEEAGKSKDEKIISESGIKSKEDVKLLLEHNVDGFLIGETFMKSSNIGESICKLFGEAYENTSN